MWEGNWSGETVLFLAHHLVLARHSCSSTSFVGSSVHLLSFELRQWVRKSHDSLVRYSNYDGTIFFHVRYEVTFYVGLLYVSTYFFPDNELPHKMATLSLICAIV